MFNNTAYNIIKFTFIEIHYDVVEENICESIACYAQISLT